MKVEQLRAVAKFWARDAGFVVSLHHCDNEAAWSEYLDGLTATYLQWGVGDIIDRARLERHGCEHFWLVHDLDGRCVGGLRIEGPYAHASEYQGVCEMSASVDHNILVAELARAAQNGLIEYKGAWGIPSVSGVGAVLGRCMQHSLWWLEAAYAFCISARHAERGWIAAGAQRLHTVSPAPYPNERYESTALLWTAGESRVAPADAVLIEAERRYLAPVRDRVLRRSGANEWHPELLLEGDGRIAQLIAEGVTVTDQLNVSMEELDELLPSVGPELRAEPAHWVYLPWRNQLLHLPGPNSFWRLRTDRSRYKLLESQLEAMRSRSVGVVGLSVGSSAAFLVAQEALCGHLRLADYDTVAPTNLNRLAASIVDLGSPKTHMIARRIAELDPYLPVTLYSEGVDSDNVSTFIRGLDVVLEECDSIDVKFLVRQEAAAQGVPVIMETSDRGLLDVERYDLDPLRQPFHGLVGDLDVADLQGLSTDDKVPHVLAILESDKLSSKMAASMIEIDQTTKTWPQLASDVTLGSSLVAASLRRLFSEGGMLKSGRARFDLDDALDNLREPVSRRREAEPAPTARPSLPTEFAAAIVEAATIAPSGGNMQPWTFELSDSAFSARISPESQVGMDIGLRGSAVACGAALTNAAVVAAAHGRLAGHGPIFDLALDVDRPDLAGRVLLGEDTNEELAALAPLLPRRLSNRHYGPSAPLSDTQLAVLEDAAQAGGGGICYIAPSDIDSAAQLWAEADRVRMLSPRLHGEMMHELRRAGIDRLSEGIDERTFEFSAADQAKLPILRRADVMAELDRLDGGVRLGEDTIKRFRASSGMLIVTVEGQSRQDYVQGGITLQRVWLAATKLGFGFHPMSPVFGYANSEEELAEIVRPDRARALFPRSREFLERVGIGPETSFVLSCRVVAGPPPSSISQRRDPHVIRQPRQALRVASQADLSPSLGA